MKTFYKISAIIIGIGFLFCALILFAAKQNAFAIICLIVAGVFPILIIKASKNRIAGVVYDSRMVRGQGFQFLETMYLIQSTKNRKTFNGRIEFMNRIYPYLVKVSKHVRYSMDVQYALSEYEKLYPDKTVDPKNVALLIEPNDKKLNELIDIRSKQL